MVEHFPYQDGLLVSYWDTSFSDNNKSEHPGSGPDPADRLAPRAAATATTARRGVVASRCTTRRSRSQRTDAFYLHLNSELNKIKARRRSRSSTTAATYWYAEAPGAGVKVPNAGVRIRVINQNKTTMWVKLTSTK